MTILLIIAVVLIGMGIYEYTKDTSIPDSEDYSEVNEDYVIAEKENTEESWITYLKKGYTCTIFTPNYTHVEISYFDDNSYRIIENIQPPSRYPSAYSYHFSKLVSEDEIKPYLAHQIKVIDCYRKMEE